MSQHTDDHDPIDALLSAHDPPPGPRVDPARLRTLDLETEAALVHDPEGRAQLVQQARGVSPELVAFAEARQARAARRPLRWGLAAVGALAAAALLLAVLRPVRLDTTYSLGPVTGGVQLQRGDGAAPTLTPDTALRVVVRPARDSDHAPFVGLWLDGAPLDVGGVERANSGALTVTVQGRVLAGRPAGRLTIDLVVAPSAGTLDFPPTEAAQALSFQVDWLPEGR